MAKAFQLIEKWEDEHGSKSSKGKAGDDEEVGVGFCYGCGKKGHYGWECPNSSEEKKKALYSKEAKRERAVKAGKVGANQLTSATKSGASNDAASVASAASKGSASKAASSKQVKQALAFMQAFQMMGRCCSYIHQYLGREASRCCVYPDVPGVGSICACVVSMSSNRLD